jgi:hypothetical protein
VVDFKERLRKQEQKRKEIRNAIFVLIGAVTLWPLAVYGFLELLNTLFS